MKLTFVDLLLGVASPFIIVYSVLMHLSNYRRKAIPREIMIVSSVGENVLPNPPNCPDASIIQLIQDTFTNLPDRGQIKDIGWRYLAMENIEKTPISYKCDCALMGEASKNLFDMTLVELAAPDCQSIHIMYLGYCSMCRTYFYNYLKKQSV